MATAVLQMTLECTRPEDLVSQVHTPVLPLAGSVVSGGPGAAPSLSVPSCAMGIAYRP